MNKKLLPKLVMVISVILTLLLVLPLAGCLGGPAAPTPEPTPEPTPTPTPEAPAEAADLPLYTFRLQGPVPPQETEELTGHFRNRVEAMSGGRIKIELYADGEIVPIDELVTAVGRGTLEMGQICGGWSPQIDIGQLETYAPQAWSSILDASAIYERGFEELLEEAYAEHNVKWLSDCLWDPIQLFTTEPINDIEDIKGLKIMGGMGASHVLQTLGAAPFETPAESFYLAISTGVADGVTWGGCRDMYNLGIHEVAPYVLNIGPTPAMCSFQINMDVWDSLPLDLQTILEVAAKDSSMYQGMLYFIEDELFYAKGEFIRTDLSDTDWVAFRKAAVDYYQQELAHTSPRAAKTVEIFSEYNASVGYWPEFDKEAFRADLPFELGKYADWPVPRDGNEIWTVNPGGDVRPYKWN